jgi:hypothetical protein
MTSVPGVRRRTWAMTLLDGTFQRAPIVRASRPPSCSVPGGPGRDQAGGAAVGHLPAAAPAPSPQAALRALPGVEDEDVGGAPHRGGCRCASPGGRADGGAEHVLVVGLMSGERRRRKTAGSSDTVVITGDHWTLHGRYVKTTDAWHVA